MSHPKIKDLHIDILSDNWYILKKATYQYEREDGTWQEQQREAYDRGNGAAILLYDTARRVILLTKQFRLPTYLNGNDDGMLIEVCAGLLDDDHPDDCIRKETQEETGYIIHTVTKVMEAYMSPGSVTEILHLYMAPYSLDMKQDDGGGLEEEQEEIESLEVSLEDALAMIKSGEIKDAKTIILIQHLAMTGWEQVEG